jgi:pyridoxine 5'-phosphate synthase PdxJ
MGEALLVGLPASIREMKRLMDAARGQKPASR